MAMQSSEAVERIMDDTDSEESSSDEQEEFAVSSFSVADMLDIVQVC